MYKYCIKTDKYIAGFCISGFWINYSDLTRTSLVRGIITKTREALSFGLSHILLCIVYLCFKEK